VLYYVLPGAGIYGGVKKGFHCADLLSGSGRPCAVATPDGARPDWFASQCEVVTHERLVRSCREGDVVLFSCPSDASFVDTLPARRKIVHMQGASTLADADLIDPRRGYEVISHGLHMTYELQRQGRVAPYVPIGVPDVFRWNGEAKVVNRIAVMPRKGADVLAAVREAMPARAELVTIDGLPESEVAAHLKRADIVLAISASEAFGLPPLEAMCARCCVVGFPGIGGFEFMRHGETAHVVPNGDVAALADALRRVSADAEYRDALRSRGFEHSGYYTLAREREYLLRALDLGAAPA
jgi:glycosyltransferase involved in cell wall biosynthesis